MHLVTRKNFFLKKRICVSVVVVLFIIGVWNTIKPLPNNLSQEGQPVKVHDEDVMFLSDETYTLRGERVVSQSIFDYIFSTIKNAETFILVDMFLWNSFGDERQAPYRKLAEEMSNALIEKKKSNPKIQMVVISDPINTSYGGHISPHFDAMKEVGITVVFTDLAALRDSNPLYSSFWRMFVYPLDRLHFYLFGKEYTFRLLPSILGAQEKVTFRSYLHLFNFKANHRKLLVADTKNSKGEKQVISIVTSANPHNGSSAHSNVAVVVKGGIWKDILSSEGGVIAAADKDISLSLETSESKDRGDVSVQLLTEGKIRDKVLSMIKSAEKGDVLQLFMFYLADIGIVEALKDAALRGVEVSLILDPNKDAFGREKNGVPNRSVAHELVSKTEGKINIRFCATSGEQCHTKLLLLTKRETDSMLLGSANYTRRNIGDYNLETNVYVSGKNVKAIDEAEKYFKRAWDNEDGKMYTVPYASFEDTSLKHRYMWKFMEITGLSTF